MNTKPYKPYGGRKKRLWLRVLLSLLLVTALCFAALEVYIAVRGHSRTTADPQPTVMVIFGCQVKPEGPSMLLRDRLDTALDYLSDHPDMPIVVTGGKGDDEHVSEAQCMYDYLTAHGVDGANIFLEDQSRTTWQNICNSKRLMEGSGLDCRTHRPLLVSNDFHLSRILILWERANPEGYAPATLAAPVSHLPSRVQMFFREPLALVKSLLLDR